MRSLINREQLLEAIKLQLRNWQNLTHLEDGIFNDLLLVRQELADKDSSIPSVRRYAINQVLWNCIKYIKEREPNMGQLLTFRFPEHLTMKGTAQKMSLTDNQVKHMQAQAIETLLDIVLSRELELRGGHALKLLSNIPDPTYNQFIGEDVMIDLYDKLIEDTTFWLWAIVGIGGIGKTALVDYLTRHLIKRVIFDEVVWLQIDPDEKIGYSLTANYLITELWERLCSSEQANINDTTKLMQLRHHLNNNPTLIIIDNLETTEQVMVTCSCLKSLANPSRFLLTSREAPKLQETIYTYRVKTFSQQTAYQFLRAHGGDDLTKAKDEQLHHIWQLTGGNPLALKLVAGLVQVFPLSEILTDFKDVESVPILEFYNFIYRRVYNSLSDDARRLLRVMPFASSSGMQVAQLKTVSELSKEALWNGIQELVQRSLFEPVGPTWDRSFRIHRLTQSFLQTEIVQMPREDE